MPRFYCCGCNLSESDMVTLHLDPHVFESIGLAIIKQAPSGMMTERIETSTDAKRFKSFFGTSANICAMLWDMIDPNSTMPKGAEPKHLLWGLAFIKVYATESVLCKMVSPPRPDEKTFRKWAKLFVDAISYLEAEIVSLFTCRLFDNAEIISNGLLVSFTSGTLGKPTRG